MTEIMIEETTSRSSPEFRIFSDRSFMDNDLTEKLERRYPPAATSFGLLNSLLI
jgi:hypothetical protein